MFYFVSISSPIWSAEQSRTKIKSYLLIYFHPYSEKSWRLWTCRQTPRQTVAVELSVIPHGARRRSVSSLVTDVVVFHV